MGEVADEQRETHERPLGRELFAVGIDGVGHRYEGVEADAHRQQHIEVRPREVCAECHTCRADPCDKEVEVLEEAEDAEV